MKNYKRILCSLLSLSLLSTCSPQLPYYANSNKTENINSSNTNKVKKIILFPFKLSWFLLKWGTILNGIVADLGFCIFGIYGCWVYSHYSKLDEDEKAAFKTNPNSFIYNWIKEFLEANQNFNKQKKSLAKDYDSKKDYLTEFHEKLNCKTNKMTPADFKNFFEGYLTEDSSLGVGKKKLKPKQQLDLLKKCIKNSATRFGSTMLGDGGMVISHFKYRKDHLNELHPELSSGDNNLSTNTIENNANTDRIMDDVD